MITFIKQHWPFRKKEAHSMVTMFTEILLGEKAALLLEFIGGILIYSSTQSGPLGTNDNGALIFGSAKYQFIISTNPKLSQWGLILIIFGFLFQLTKNLSVLIRYSVFIGGLIGLFFSLLN